MALPTLRRLRSSDDSIRQLQDAADAVFKVITAKQILDGNFIEDVVVTGGTPLVIDHKLGRKLRGWILCRKNENLDVWDSQTENPTPQATLILNTLDSGNPLLPNIVTISLWVF